MYAPRRNTGTSGFEFRGFRTRPRICGRRVHLGADDDGEIVLLRQSHNVIKIPELLIP